MSDGWQTLGATPPGELVDARLQLHHAAQVAAAAGATFLEARPDDSHPNLGWVDALGALVGHPIPGPPAFQVGLAVADFRLLLLDGAGRPSDALPLAGRTLAEATAWLGEAIERTGARVPTAGVSLPGYDVPDHPTAAGAAFSADPDACAELGRWFAGGQAVLEPLVAGLPGAGEARCWPHHFDLGTLEVVETAADGSLAKSVGIGLSPGDESYPQPYWYVSPWPYPAPDSLPALALGGWHREGYIAAILTGSELVAAPPDAQRARVESFLDAAHAASRALLAR